MSKQLTCLKCVLLLICIQFNQNVLALSTGDFQTKNPTGNWSDFNSWNMYDGVSWIPANFGQLPAATTAVYIQADHVMAVDNANAICNDLNITGNTNSRISFPVAGGILNVKGNMNVYSTGHICFGTWVPGAKIVFSGTGTQGFTNLSVNAVFANVEVNKLSGTLATSSNFRFATFILTRGNFLVGSGNEMQGSSSSASITINGGTWTQTGSTTKINNSGIVTSPIGPLTINGGEMILATSNKAGGFQFSTISIANGGTLTLQNFAGLINVTTSISIDPGGTFQTALTATLLPPSVAFKGLVSYNNAGAQIITAATYSYLKLDGTGVKTLGAGTTSIPANGTLEMAGTGPSIALAASGNTFNVSATGTNLIYSSLSSQTAGPDDWNPGFQNITVNSAATVTMTGLSRVVNGSLNLANGTLNIGVGNSLTLNGVDLNRANGFISGTATSDLAITGTTGGPVSLPVSGNISLRNVTVSGIRKLLMNGSNNIVLSGLFTIGASATYDNGGESQITAGGGASVVINGRFINRDKDNFTGTNGAIPGITPTLNPGCTIEYALAGNQTVTGRSDYQHITFSGSGLKSLANAITPAGTVYITGSAIVDANGHNIGDGYTLTNFVMDGGRMILGTVGTQPMMAGNYTLTAGVVQFNGSSLQYIRPKNYQNIEITGVGVANSDGNITLNTNGTFTVKNGGVFEINDNNITGTGGTQSVTVESGGTFRCGNNQGFNGFVPTLTNNSSINAGITNISLNAGSTVEYIRKADQPITNANNLVYQNLALAGSGNKIAPSTMLTVQGNLQRSANAVFSHNNGTVLLNGGGTQSFAGLTYNNLILTNGTKNTAGSSTIVDSIKINTATTLYVSAMDKITLHSDAIKTARVGRVDGVINYHPTGQFCVERYISKRKAWRFLAVPLNPSQTIKQAWQENATSSADNPLGGYGTQITSDKSNWLSLGFDSYSLGGPSMKTYNANTNTYTGIASTEFNSFDPASGGYMVFIRGDRSATGVASPVSSTVLRMAGKLFSGDQPAFLVPAGKILPVNNPYASPLDLRNLSRSYNLYYYVFDPNAGGVYGYGGFQTFSWNGTDYDVVPGGGSYGPTNNWIESGQAFFVSTLVADATLQFTENVKTSATVTVHPLIPVGIPAGKLRTNLHRANEDGSTELADGVLCSFHENYSDDMAGMNAKKFLNAGENLSVRSNAMSLAVERRHTLQPGDTIALEISGISSRQYVFEIIPDGIAGNGLNAFLEDDYLHTITPVSFAETTKINFAVNNESGSSSTNRFRLVFKGVENSLAVSFKSFEAHRQNEGIKVEWQVDNESGVKNYEIERSSDGRLFTSLQSIATNDMAANSHYSWFDHSPLNGYNYYRVKSVDQNGDIHYSNILKVMMPEVGSYISVYPNPVSDEAIHLRFRNQPKGTYQIKLVGESGKPVAIRIFKHNGGSATLVFTTKTTLARGVYVLQVGKPDGSVEKQNVLY